MKFKEREEAIYTSNEHYDLMVAGYINPFELLEDENEAREVYLAMGVIDKFLAEAEEQGVIEVG